jgi:hypothetical protein
VVNAKERAVTSAVTESPLQRSTTHAIVILVSFINDACENGCNEVIVDVVSAI